MASGLESLMAHLTVRPGLMSLEIFHTLKVSKGIELGDTMSKSAYNESSF